MTGTIFVFTTQLSFIVTSNSKISLAMSSVTIKVLGTLSSLRPRMMIHNTAKVWLLMAAEGEVLTFL